MFKEYAKEVEVAEKIALMAGEIMLQYFDIDQQVQTKEDNSSVTIADTMINSMVIKELTKEFPEDGVIGEEESTSEYGLGRKWFCDPIDGTEGYIWGTPTAMFSLGLVINGVPTVGIVYDPFLKRLYRAVKGQGSFSNERRLSVSNKDLINGIIAVTSRPMKIISLKYIPELNMEGAKFAMFSGAVCKSCLVARGKFEGYVEQGVNAHDMAAVQVIVEEAGGKVTGFDGQTLDYSKRFKGAVVSNGKIHDEFLAIISR